MEAHNEAVPGTAAWLAEGLRLTAFLGEPLNAQPNLWWAELVGQPPESETSRPREGEWQVDGPLDRPGISNARLALSSSAARIDWRLVARPESDEAFFEPLHLGAFAEVMTVFVDMMLSWLALGPLVLSRLALGAVLKLPVESRAQGYEILSGYLPFPLDPDSSDFIYQINRPRPSTSLGDGTLINRLQNWNVVQFQTQVVTISPGVSITETPSEGRPFFACRLSLDINTAAGRPDPLPQERLSDLLRELAAETGEIAERGDQQ